jgi:hypothetical protein
VKRILILLVSLFCALPHSEAKEKIAPETYVLIVHGTFAHKAPWAQSGGAFFEEIQNTNPKLHIDSFNWGGGMGDDRIKAGEVLAEHLLNQRKKYPNARIILIGHSHGGNVINIASQLLANAINLRTATGHSTFINELENIAHLGQDAVSQVVSRSMAKKGEKASIKTSKRYKERAQLAEKEGKKKKAKLYRALAEATELAKEALKLANPEEIPSLVQKATAHIKSMLPKTHWYEFWKSPITLPLVNESYLLATPVHPEAFLPNREIIGHTYIFSSFKDHVQRVGDAFDRFYPAHQDHITNLHTTLSGKNPSHGEMHHPSIARWLLSTPMFIDRNHRYYHIHFDTNPSSNIRPKVKHATQSELEVGKYKTPLHMLKKTKEQYKKAKKASTKKKKQLEIKMRKTFKRNKRTSPPLITP